MKRSRKIASATLALVFSIVLFFQLTDFKHIHISNDTSCQISFIDIKSIDGWPTWITGKIDKNIGRFQILNVRHLGHQSEFLIQIEVDGVTKKVPYNAVEKSFHPTGDSAMPNDGRLHLDAANTSCKLSKE